MHLGAVLSRDDDSILKDLEEKKNESVLKRAHEETSLSINASAVLSNFARVIVIWSDNFIQESAPNSFTLRRPLLKINRAVQFVSDTTLDNLKYAARSQAANGIVRQNLCLKYWRVDTLSKTNLSIENFSSHLLFRKGALEKVLVETKEKKKKKLCHSLLPTTIKNQMGNSVTSSAI